MEGAWCGGIVGEGEMPLTPFRHPTLEPAPGTLALLPHLLFQHYSVLYEF